MLKMDNPQETKKMDISEIQWLAGFFEAEGSISFNYKPCVDIVNTCPKTIFYLKNILERFGIKVGINEREKPSKSSKKKRWDIFLRHDEQIIPFINLVDKFVYGKQKQINIVKEWYKNKNSYIKDKLKFANQLSNIIVVKKEHVMMKLNTVSLNKYADIPVLNETDGNINLYDDFNSIYYIAGLIDGDGCFCMSKRDVKNNRSRYTPQVLMVNTNKEIIRRYCSVLKNNNIGHRINFRLASKTTNRKRWDITTSGVRRCKKICDLLLNIVYTKREQCRLLSEYCNYRLLNEKSSNDVLGYECKKAIEDTRKN